MDNNHTDINKKVAVRKNDRSRIHNITEDVSSGSLGEEQEKEILRQQSFLLFREVVLVEVPYRTAGIDNVVVPCGNDLHAVILRNEMCLVG